MNDGGNFFYESKAMAQFILAGHSLEETADEFGVCKGTVRYRLKSIGFTYSDLAKIRKERSKQAR